jgi:hypothetical protein
MCVCLDVASSGGGEDEDGFSSSECSGALKDMMDGFCFRQGSGLLNMNNKGGLSLFQQESSALLVSCQG